jgi:hypothetical protein
VTLRLRARPAAPRPRAQPIPRIAVVAALAVLGGCSSVAPLSGTTAAAPKVVLGRTDVLLFLKEREIPNYTCSAGLVLQCERGGVNFACACSSSKLQVGRPRSP